jgi:hypothetical protein
MLAGATKSISTDAGLEKLAKEWPIICLTYNLLKLFCAGLRTQIAQKA